MPGAACRDCRARALSGAGILSPERGRTHIIYGLLELRCCGNVTRPRSLYIL